VTGPGVDGPSTASRDAGLAAPWAGTGMRSSLGEVPRAGEALRGLSVDEAGRPAAEGEVVSRATTKLRRSVLLAGLLAFVGFLAGRVELLVLAAPLLLALGWWLAHTRTPSIRLGLDLDTARCLEGDLVTATVVVGVDVDDGRGRRPGRPVVVEVGVAVPPGFWVEGPPAQRLLVVEAGEPRSVTVTLRAVRWGAYPIGRLAARVHGPGALVAFERVVDRMSTVRIFPEFERLRRGVVPPDPRAQAGEYVSRLRGEGLEFAEVRPFAPGDRIRRVNWRVTSRHDALYVNQFHPERNAEVVLFLDTFADVGPRGRSSLELAVRGSAILARYYLRHRDRVGLVSFGGLLDWITAGTGDRQLFRIVDYLMAVDQYVSFAWKDLAYLPARTLPPRALVVAFSPLEDERALRALANLRARRFPLVIVDTLDESVVPRLPGPGGDAAYRAWRVGREGVRDRLASLGAPVVPWPGTSGLEAAFAAAPRFMGRGAGGR
jgi:uncharacterized protein (DUF58 family)